MKDMVSIKAYPEEIVIAEAIKKIEQMINETQDIHLTMWIVYAMKSIMELGGLGMDEITQTELKKRIIELARKKGED